MGAAIGVKQKIWISDFLSSYAYKKKVKQVEKWHIEIVSKNGIMPISKVLVVVR